MSEPDATGGIDWDDVVDFLCIGINPGVLAYLSVCAANDLDALALDWPAVPDPQTGEYLAEMTADLGDLPAEPGPAATRAVPVPPPTGRRKTVETFVGEHLRRWSAHCLAAPSGILFTQVPDMLSPMRTDTGELVTAVAVPADVPPIRPVDRYAGMVLEEGRIVGAWVEGPDGRLLVRADGGLVFAIGGPAGDSPSGPDVALAGRRGGRFARLEQLVLERS